MNIQVQEEDQATFSVTVGTGRDTKDFRVTLSDDDHRGLAGEGESKASLIKRSFEFLLEREPKESILSSFDLTVISRYFPEYEKTIRR